MRRIFSFFMLLTIILSAALPASAQTRPSEPSTEVNATISSSNEVTISGTITSSAGDQVTVRVFDPNGDLDYINQTQSDSGGRFAFTYKLANGAKGLYQVEVGGANATTPATATFTYNPGGSGGNDSGSGSSSSTEPPTESLVIKAAIDASGASIIVITEAQLRSTIEGAKNSTLKIDIQGVDGAANVSLKLPAQLVKSAAESGLKRLEIKAGGVGLSFDLDEIGSAIGTGAEYLILNIAKVDSSTLPEETRNKLGDSTVYDLTLSIDGNTIDNFNSRTGMAVILSYALKAGQAAGKVVVYYIDNDGTLEVVKNGKYDSAKQQIKFAPKHFSMYTATYNDITYSDLNEVSWAKESIEALAAREAVAGVGNGLFVPRGKVTRAEFIKLIVQAFDLNDAAADSTFSDVNQGTWYYSAIAAAQQLGIVQGRSDGSFGVNDEISRQDMAVIVYRVAQLLKLDLNGTSNATPFADKSDIASYAINAVTAMQNSGLIQGVGGGRFAPSNSAARAEAAVIAYRLFNLKVDSSDF